MNPFKKNNKTFKPKKAHSKGTKRYQLHKLAKATLGSGDMRQAVALPSNEDLNEWLATNTLDFYNEISLLYGTISDFCTAKTCPVMSAGSKFEYLWADGTNIKTPIKCPAPEYVDYLMAWVDSQLDNEDVFPTEVGNPFPKNFSSVVKNIFKRLFRVYGHIYHSHFEKVVSLGAEAHLNTCFKHFIYFVQEFHLIEKDQLAPLQELIDNLIGAPPAGATASAAR